MKLGILGTGMIVKDLMKTFHTLDIEESYILGTENTKEETEKIVEEYDLTGTYYDYDEMLKSDIDTVYVALPNHLHYSFTKKALMAGKHVICEKPITSNYQELEELMMIADEKKLILLEAMTLHYMPAYQSLKEKVKDLGNIKIVTLNYSQYSSRYNAFKEGTILPAFDYHKSGGALMDINVYNIHFIVGIFGKPKSVEYLANIERNIDTSGILILDYGSFKAVSIGAKDCKAPLMNTIQGDQGNIVITTPVSRMVEYTYNSNSNESIIINLNEYKHAMSYEYQEFIRIINELDYKKAKELLKVSAIASELMTTARKKANIVFESDTL